MIVISDANTIYSCFYKPGGVVTTILKNDKKRPWLIAPPYPLDEIKRRLPKIMEKSSLTKKQANKLLEEFTEYITFYNLEEVEKKNRIKTAEITKDMDPDDHLFTALHFQKGHKIWTCNAKLAEELEEKGYDVCVTIQQLKEKIHKKGT